MTEFAKNVYAAVRNIPRGCVMSYGRVAALWQGIRDAARGVGFALHHNPYPGVMPCHRVVFADGSIWPAPSPSAARACRGACSRTRAWSSCPTAAWT